MPSIWTRVRRLARDYLGLRGYGDEMASPQLWSLRVVMIYTPYLLWICWKSYKFILPLGDILNYVDRIITITPGGTVTLNEASQYTGSQDHAKISQPPAIVPHVKGKSSRGWDSKQTAEKSSSPTQTKTITTITNSQQSKGSIAYLKSIGLLRGLIFLILLVSQSFFTTFPSKYNLIKLSTLL